ncbi:MAG: RsmE family RNA methyltransferase [Bryobacteraceae bacterium]
MARRLFFVPEVRNGRAEILDDDAAHLTCVLRVEAGERFEISDNLNVYLAEVEVARKQRVVFRTLERLPAVEPPVRLALFAALVKFDHFEWIVEKATELGVETIVPVAAARSEKGLEQAALRRIGRWRRIALEASQQSRRARLPELEPPASFAGAIVRVATHRYLLEEASGAPPMLTSFPERRIASDEIAILVGPEGGWTDEERERIMLAGWRAVSLGPLILRSETAALAALALVSCAWQG